MDLPDNVRLTDLFERIRRIYTETLQNNIGIPEYAIGYIKEIIKDLTGNKPDLEQLSSHANGILYWYFDQGFKEIPVHASLSGFALDIVKMRDVKKTLLQAELLLSKPDAPDGLPEIVDILRELMKIFAPDGRMDNERYNELAPRLRELCRSNHGFLENYVDPAIFHI